MMEDKALLSEYLSESEELLDSLLTDLDSLASRLQEPPDINLINRIFRTAHSLKGLSGMMELPEVQSLAHEFEDILDDLRLGQLSLDEETAAIFQEAGAGLAALVGGAARGAATEDDFERLRQLLSTIATRPRQRGKKTDSELESLALSQKERALLTEYEEHRIVENLKAGRTFYAVTIQLEVTSLDKEYRRLTAKLEEKGELITTLPETAQSASLVAFKLIFATQQKENDLNRLVEPLGARAKSIGPSSWRRAGAALMQVGRKQKKRKQKNEGGKPERLNNVLPPAFAQESLQPLSPSVRVDLSQIDELSGLAHELSNEMARLASMAESFLQAAGLGAREQFDLRFSARRIEREFVELEERLVELRMISLTQIFTRAARLASRLARELGKSVSVEVAGRETHLDKMIVDRISDSIYHVLRNAIDHGIELPDERRLAGKSARGKVKIEASLEGARAVIAITDDGRGIDADEVFNRAVEAGIIAPGEELSREEILRLIVRPGVSTAESVSSVSGRGVGLDAVERTMYELGGEIRISSEKGKWTRFELAVPTTLVMISAFIVRASEYRYAINVAQLIELMYVTPEDIIGRDGRRSIDWRGATIPLIELKYLLGLGGARVLHKPGGGDSFSGQIQPGEIFHASASLRVPVFITRAGDRQVAIAVEQFEEQREIIVKSLGPLSRGIRGVVGAVDLEGGDVAIVLDLPSLLFFRSVRL